MPQDPQGPAPSTADCLPVPSEASSPVGGKHVFETECKESLGIINCTYIGIGVSVVLYHLIRHHPTKKNIPNKTPQQTKLPPPARLPKKLRSALQHRKAVILPRLVRRLQVILHPAPIIPFLVPLDEPPPAPRAQVARRAHVHALLHAGRVDVREVVRPAVGAVVVDAAVAEEGLGRAGDWVECVVGVRAGD